MGIWAFLTRRDLPFAAAISFQSWTVVRRIFTSWMGLDNQKEQHKILI